MKVKEETANLSHASPAGVVTCKEMLSASCSRVPGSRGTHLRARVGTPGIISEANLQDFQSL